MADRFRHGIQRLFGRSRQAGQRCVASGWGIHGACANPTTGTTICPCCDQPVTTKPDPRFGARRVCFIDDHPTRT